MPGPSGADLDDGLDLDADVEGQLRHADRRSGRAAGLAGDSERPCAKPLRASSSRGGATSRRMRVAKACVGADTADAKLAATLKPYDGQAIDVLGYHEHAIGSGAEARAAAYLELRIADTRTLFGVGIDENITTASFRALFSALNRALGQAAEQAA